MARGHLREGANRAPDSQPSYRQRVPVVTAAAGAAAPAGTAPRCSVLISPSLADHIVNGSSGDGAGRQLVSIGVAPAFGGRGDAGSAGATLARKEGDPVGACQSSKVCSRAPARNVIYITANATVIAIGHRKKRQERSPLRRWSAAGATRSNSG